MKFLKQITEKSWLAPEEDVVADLRSVALVMGTPSAKIGLRVFLTVVLVVFSLFCVAYYIRMELDDWRPLPEPDLLWINTVVILLSSVALQYTRYSVQRSRAGAVNAGLLAAGLLTIGFLVGQYMAWEELRSAGYFAATNPANAFFYLLTAVHGLHLIGGLVVWARTTLKVWNGAEPYQIRLSVELCTTYWHFLALVWLAILWILIST
jgi:cytochrome c oxidase subunit 3